MDIVIFGLSLSSSWGNGHATTYRALLRGLAAEGHSVLFLERDVPWYAGNRDLADPDFCRLVFYDDIEAVIARHREELCAAGAVIVGSYVPEGARLIDALLREDLGHLAFYDIDTPVTLDLLDRKEEVHLAQRQVAAFDTYFSFAGGRSLEVLRERHGARRPLPLYCAVDETAYYPDASAAPDWDLGYLGTYSADRQPRLERFLLAPARELPDLRFVVAGSGYPEDIDWPQNVERIEHLPPERHRAFYNRQRFTLNITRDAMRRLGWSPSVRLFEAAACGTPILSDTWPGLEEVLPPGEALIPLEHTRDAVAALTGLSRTARTSLAQAARERVLASHTGRARARQMIRGLQATEAVPA